MDATNQSVFSVFLSYIFASLNKNGPKTKFSNQHLERNTCHLRWTRNLKTQIDVKNVMTHGHTERHTVIDFILKNI